MAGRFSVETIFRAVDKLSAPVTKMQNRIRRFTRVTRNNFRKLNRTVNKFGQSMKRVGRTAAISAVLFAGLGVNVLAAGVDFEQAITNVGAVGLKTREQIAPLEQMALQLGRTTKFTATEAANAMEILAKAGFNTQQILKATPAVLSAAAASGLEIADVAGHVSNVLKGMGLEMDQSARVADVLALASARTNSTIGTLGESMKNVASTARQLNIPLEDVVASVAALQDVGLDASVAGSAMNVMLTKMAAPSAKIQKIMRRLKISFKDVKGNMKPLGVVISDLNKASKKMGGNFDQVAFFAELVGLRGQKAAANLSKLFETGKLAELTKELGNAKGVADKMANLRMDTVTGSLLLLNSAVDAVKVKIFDLNKGPLKDTIDGFTKWVSANEDLIATRVGDFLGELIANLDNIVRVGKQVAGVITIFILMSAAIKIAAFATVVFNAINIAFAVTLGTLKFAMIAYTAVMTGLPKILAFARMAMLALNIAFAANPIGLVVVAITAFIGLAALMITAWDPVRDFFADLFEKIQSVASGAAGALKDFGNFFGFGDDEDETKAGGAGAPSIVSPQERIARSIEESRSTSNSEVTIKDETGRAEVTGGKMGPGLSLQQTGAF